jgi:imidazoleglycerol-phosphate dehydratase
MHSGEPAGQEQVLIGTSYLGSLTRHVFESISAHAAICLHMRVLSGRDAHHIVEAQFKALARALRDAVAVDPRESGVPSTKGSL